MSNFTHISPATTVNLLSLKTPALITLYTTIHNHVSPSTTPSKFTNKSTKLQIVTVLNNILAANNTTYEVVQSAMASQTAYINGEIPAEDVVSHLDGAPVHVPTDAEHAIAASAIKRLRKNGVADETIRSTLTEALSAPCTTEDDGTTSHGVATAGLAIMDTPATSRRTTNPTGSNPRTTLLPTQIITSVVATNPKKPHGASAARFNAYYTLTAPFTVADVLANTSITRGDILWDVRHGFITFA